MLNCERYLAHTPQLNFPLSGCLFSSLVPCPLEMLVYFQPCPFLETIFIIVKQVIYSFEVDMNYGYCRALNPN